MVTIDLSAKNAALYSGKVRQVKGVWRIEVDGQEGANLVAQNVLKIALATPLEKRDEVLITGVAPRWAALAALGSVRPFFKIVKHYDGKDLIILPSWTQPSENLEKDPD